MFGIHIPEQEIDRAVERVLSNQRVERIARKVAEMLLEQLLAGLKAEDQQRAL
jgi:hypothetical protein